MRHSREPLAIAANGWFAAPDAPSAASALFLLTNLMPQDFAKV
jgi:hypothetical protein